MATSGLPTRSRSLKSRPLSRGMAIVSNQPGVVALRQTRPTFRRSSGVIGSSFTPTLLVNQPPPVSSRIPDREADLTPGVAAAASRRRSTRAPRSSGGIPLASRFIWTTTSGSGTKPSGNRLSDANVRRKSPAAMTRTNETAICTTTSTPRTAKRRSPAIERPAPLRASPGARLLTAIMGATPAMIAHRHARVAVNTSTRQSSARSSETVLSHVSNC